MCSTRSGGSGLAQPKRIRPFTAVRRPNDEPRLESRDALTQGQTQGPSTQAQGFRLNPDLPLLCRNVCFHLGVGRCTAFRHDKLIGFAVQCPTAMLGTRRDLVPHGEGFALNKSE